MKSSRHNRGKASRLVPTAFAVALVAAFVPSQDAFAQAEGTEPAASDIVEVTGSRIARRQAQGPQPIQTISREDIAAAGDVSLAEFIQAQNFNSFGSFNPASGFGGGAQGQAEISVRGLGSARTLVLVDGRRIAASPAFSGAAQNLNAIPLALVERVEILREGASAIYGSDAIGGVINIITKKTFEGIELSGQVERPTQDGGDGSQYSMVTGMASDRGNFTFSAEHFQRDIIFRRDRDYLFAQEPSPLGGPGSFYRVDDRAAPTTGTRPSPNGGIIEPFANCPQDFDSATFPSSARRSFPLFTNDDVLCLYRFTDDAGQTASVKRDSVSFAANFLVNDDVTAFSRVNVTRVESFGRFAAAPVTPVLGGLTMAADNPNNPTAGEAGGPSDIVLLFRPVAGGPRDSVVKDNVQQLMFGLTGKLDVANSTTWEVAVYDNRYTQSDIGLNYGLRPQLQALVDNGTLDPFDPDPSTFAGFAHSIFTDNLFRSRGADVRMSLGDLLGGGLRLPLSVGAEYRDDVFATVLDQQSVAGNVFGSAGSSASGERNYYALYAETLLSFLNDSLEVGFALRRDTYSDFGSELSPKISLGFRPSEMVLLRGSYSEGFRAPDLSVLFRAPSQGFPNSVDRLGCQLDPNNAFACNSRQRETFSGSNPNLQAELSKNYNFGVVFNPMPDLELVLDYYNIEIADGIGSLSAQNVLDNEQTCFNEGRTCNPSQEGSVVRAAPDAGAPIGAVVQINAPAANFTQTKTDGLDFDAAYRMSTPIGRLGFNINASYVLSFERSTAPGAPLEEVTDSFFSPKWRGIARTSWSQGPFSSNVLLNHIPSTKDCTVRQLNTGNAACSNSVGSFTTLDLQLGYNAPWGGDIQIGARNLFDRDPPLSVQEGTPEAPLPDQNLVSIFGRVPYVRYTHRF